ncbi:MAG: hypothetical protein AAF486_07865 [Pseudomonadota bacterium]
MEAVLLLRAGGVLATGLGLACLYVAAKDRGGSRARVAAGWGLLALATLCWAASSSAERGIALGLIWAMLLVLAGLAVTALSTPRKAAARRSPRRAIQGAGDKTSAGALASRAISALLLGPIAGLSALAVSTAAFALADRAGAEHTINLVAAMFLFPLAWAAIAALVAMEPRLWRRAAWTFAAGLAPLGAVFAIA